MFFIGLVISAIRISDVQRWGSAVEIATLFDEAEYIPLLIAHGADVNMTDEVIQGFLSTYLLCCMNAITAPLPGG